MNEFLYHNSYFNKKYQDKLDARFWTFKIALNLFLQFKGKNIVETGCLREVNDYGAGYSTYLFGEFCDKYKCRFWTCDKDKKNLDLAKRITMDFVLSIDYVLSDSKVFLWGFKEPIDLLYLDALDCDPDNRVKTEAAQQFQLDEIKIVYPHLNKRAIVLLDDNNHPWGGKTKLSKRFLAKNGFVNIMDYQQSLWIRDL